MKNLFIIISLLFVVISIQAQNTTKVLFIGNSFTSQNNLPNIFKQLAEGAGHSVVVASHMPGGVSVGDIAQGDMAHMNNPEVYSLIRSNDWDYVVLQDNQGRFCLGYGQFPPSSLVIEGHLQIRDSVLFHNPCAHMIWFAGFGPKDGVPPYGNTGSALIDTIYNNYQFLRDTVGQIIAPIGAAFKHIIQDYPAINLWSSDATHPSLYGSYLTACVLYTTIFKSSVENSSYNSGMPVEYAQLFKTIGYQTTIDSINVTGLNEITPIIEQNGNTLSASNSMNCAWYVNGVLVEANDCTIDINEDGDYYVIASDQDGCEFRSMENYFVSTNIIENLNNLNDIEIFPNPAKDQITLSSDQFSKYDNYDVVIYDLMGNLVKSATVSFNENIINVEDLSSGIYLLNIKSPEYIRSLKFIIQK